MEQENGSSAAGSEDIDPKYSVDDLRPLIVDIDGTLTRTDFLYECFFHALKKNPLIIFSLIGWLMRGRGYLKHRLYELGHDKVSLKYLPYREEVLETVERVKTKGHQIVLASGSDERFVNSVAAHLDLPGEHYGSSESVNFTASQKAESLANLFPNGFDYIGNSFADIAVWNAAKKSYGAGVSKSLVARAQANGIKLEIIATDENVLRPLIKALRLHQWAKNALIFTILVITYPAAGISGIIETFLGFILLGMVASSTYIINDLLDIEADRRHATKRKRPFAAGTLTVPHGVGVASIFLLTAHIGAFLITPLFCAVVAFYTLLTVSYSLSLKRFAVLDVFCLAALFNLRVISGGAIIYIAPSPWLLSFMFFFFLSLALAKRAVELKQAPKSERGELVSGRGYNVDDLDFVVSSGLATAALAMNIFFIYSLLADLTLFSTPWLAMAAGCLLAYWMLRLWFLAIRGDLHDDPVYFAIKDGISILLGVILILFILI